MDVILEGAAIIDDDTPPVSTSTGRGFSNPDVLAKAQETRKANRAQSNPTDFAETNEPTSGAKRGRKPKADRNLQGVEQVLLATHMMLATVTGHPELILDKQEGHILAEALANLGDHYKIKLDGKTGAIMGLVYAIGIVYGPRAVVIGAKIRSDRKASHDPVS